MTSPADPLAFIHHTTEGTPLRVATFREPPLAHQAAFLARPEQALAPAHGLFWEQGTAKTFAAIHNAVLLLRLGLIDQMLVLAPTGVHRNWHLGELPRWWPADAPPYLSFAWDTSKSGTKLHAAEHARFMSETTAPAAGLQPRRFGVLCMSYDSLMTPAGKQAQWDFLRRAFPRAVTPTGRISTQPMTIKAATEQARVGRTLYVADESQRFKTPDAKRTDRVLASSAYAGYRRALSGTPMDTPLDIYSQVRFLDPWFWQREFSIGSFVAFRAYFAVYETKTRNSGDTYEVLTAYRNLDQLEAALRHVSHRVGKGVLGLLPPRYKRVFHELSPDQRRAYDELREDCLTRLSGGELVTADMALTMQLRLMQISAGFVTPRAGEQPVPFRRNPRAEVFTEYLRDTSGPSLVWCNWRHDFGSIEKASLAAGRRPVFYDGSEAQKDRAVAAWRDGMADDLVANLGSNMVEGYTLLTPSAFYYSNTPRSIARQQSQDRNHRQGTEGQVVYTDFFGERTIDLKRQLRHMQKREWTGAVLGDDPEATRSWLREALEEE